MIPIMRTNSIISFVILISLIGYSSLSYSAKSTSLADIISNNVFDVRLADRCGDVIPADRKAFDRCKKQSGGPEKFPPIASEACAYDRVGDTLKLSFDEAQVSVDDVTTHINIYDENDINIYDNKIEQLPFVLYERKKRVESWPLTNQAGGQLQVGRQGKKYTAQIERRKQGDIRYTTGVMDIFVDDCDLRNQKIVSMISDPSIDHTPGFDLYLELLNSVSTKICNKIKTGLLGTAGADTFSQRCRYQCINNSFTNELINQAYAGTNTRLAQTHEDVRTRTTVEFHFAAENWRTGVDRLDQFPMLLAYITYEDTLRAAGYTSCNGPLNTVDIDQSITIIGESVQEVIFPLFGASRAAEASGFIQKHLKNTEKLYNNP